MLRHVDRCQVFCNQINIATSTPPQVLISPGGWRIWFLLGVCSPASSPDPGLRYRLAGLRGSQEEIPPLSIQNCSVLGCLGRVRWVWCSQVLFVCVVYLIVPGFYQLIQIYPFFHFYLLHLVRFCVFLPNLFCTNLKDVSDYFVTLLNDTLEHMIIYVQDSMVSDMSCIFKFFEFLMYHNILFFNFNKFLIEKGSLLFYCCYNFSTSIVLTSFSYSFPLWQYMNFATQCAAIRVMVPFPRFSYQVRLPRDSILIELPRSYLIYTAQSQRSQITGPHSFTKSCLHHIILVVILYIICIY